MAARWNDLAATVTAAGLGHHGCLGLSESVVIPLVAWVERIAANGSLSTHGQYDTSGVFSAPSPPLSLNICSCLRFLMTTLLALTTPSLEAARLHLLITMDSFPLPLPLPL